MLADFASKKVFIFGLDDVLFPQRDYDLQIYYLFAQFVEFLETVPPAADLTAFMKKAYEHHGAEGIFDRAAQAFGISTSYLSQFERLHKEAKLPLPLLIYPEVLSFMKTALENGKQLLVLTDGDPAVQLNKLKHLEWNGLDSDIKVFFKEELRLAGIEVAECLTKAFHVEVHELGFFGKEELANFT